MQKYNINYLHDKKKSTEYSYDENTDSLESQDASLEDKIPLKEVIDSILSA